MTSVPRTLLDLAGRGFRTEGALDQAVHEGLTALGEMWLLYEKEWTRGRRGIAIMRDLLRQRTPGQAPTHSELEVMFRAAMRGEGLPEPVAQFPFELPTGLIHVDFFYREANLAIELDGYAWHSDRSAFERDRLRDGQLQALGIRVLRLTWAQLRFDSAGTADLVLRCLQQLGRQQRQRSVICPVGGERANARVSTHSASKGDSAQASPA